MEELKDIHSNNAEWGCIARLVEKIGNEEDRIGWPKLIDMVAEAYTEAEKETDPLVLFFTWHQFFFRLYYRVRNMKEPADFDQVYEDRDGYRIINYSYKMFIFARKRGATENITNGYLVIPENKLSQSEKKKFDKKVIKP